jgi:voltage-gated potassium channel
MMEFPIDTGAGDIVRRDSYIHSLDVAEGRSDVESTRSSAKRDENGAVILQFPRGGNQVLKLGADVDELEQERLMALMDEKYMTWKHRWFSILEGRPHDMDETLSLVFNIVSFTTVIISIIVFAVASVPEITGGKQEVDINDPLFWIETICIIYFIGEAALRLYCVPFQLVFNALVIIDLVTIAGYFTDFFAGASVSFLRVLRLLRVFRVMKISRYSRTLQLVFKVFAQSASGLSVLLMPIFLVVITSATVLYFIEVSTAEFNLSRKRWFYPDGRPAMFQSIFDGVWFTMATITTIGYGDFVPVSLAGKIIASMLALFGVLTLSFPTWCLVPT